MLLELATGLTMLYEFYVFFLVLKHLERKEAGLQCDRT